MIKKILLIFLTLLLCWLTACQGGGGTEETVLLTDGDDSEPSPTQVLEETTEQELEEEKQPMDKIQTYQNPIMTANSDQAWQGYGFGDPFVMRHNGVYYLYESTKDGCVGVKCWSSTDLVNWSYEGFCSTDPLTEGAYAPEVYYYNGYFYMYTSPAGHGHYVFRSTSPNRGFEAVTGNMGMSIDGSVFMDNDGSWYFYTAGQGAMQVYDMTSPTTMINGRPMSGISVNDGWTEGGMVVYHDGYYYMTYTGNHVMSPAYRILYGVSDRSPISFAAAEDRPPLLVNTTNEVHGIGHSSTVKGPDLDSYYIVYHSLINRTPNRNMNIDRISFNGSDMKVLGPTVRNTQAPAMPDVYHHFAPGSSLKGWRLEGELAAGGGMTLGADSRLISTQNFDGDFTAEYNIRSIADGARGGALFGYADGENYGSCVFDPAAQEVIITVTVSGESTVTRVPLVRSFDEDVRFDCLQSLQIERCGKAYTFYMNDRLLCTLTDSPLTGGSVGYVTEGGTVTVGFIGCTGAVGGRGSADEYKSVSELCGLIPAVEYEGETLPSVSVGDRFGVSVKPDTPVSYRILASVTGTYDLSLLYTTEGNDGVEVLLDGASVGTLILQPDRQLQTAVLRSISLTKGQHVLTLVPSKRETCFVELALQMGKEVKAKSWNLGERFAIAAYSDGEWDAEGSDLIAPSREFTGKRLYGSRGWGDYTAELVLTLRGGSNCGLLLRATNPGTPAFLDDIPTTEDSFVGTDWVQGYYVGLDKNGVFIGKQGYGYTELSRAEGDFAYGREYTLRVECYGALLRVFVDGTLYLEYTDPEPYLQGMVGIRAYRCKAELSSLTVSP